MIGVGLITGLAGCNSTGDGGGDGGPPDGDGQNGGTGQSGGGASETLGFGESYENAYGLVTTVHGIERADGVEYEGRGGGTVTRTAAAAEQWAVVDIEVVNGTEGPEYLPPSDVFELAAAGTRYRNAAIGAQGDRGYSAGEVAAGGSDRGRLLYQVPASLDVSDVALVYSNDTPEGTWSVRWEQA